MAIADDLIQGLQFRPKPYITLGYTPVTISRADIKDTASLAAKLTEIQQLGFKEIGAVQRLEVNSTRDTNVWRELDWKTAGKPVESYPGLPSYDLSLERIVLYQSNLLGAIGFDDMDIIKQNKPLTIKVEMKDPGSELATPPATTYDKVWYIAGVWFQSNPMSFDVVDVGDLRIIQEVSAIASGIFAAPVTP